MTKIDKLVPACRKLLAVGDTEAALLFLRENGCSKIDSMKALMAASGIPLKDAKSIVHLSQTWSDARERDEAVWDELVDAVKEIDNEQF